MDVQQFFKRDHAKMSTLFDKLAETSDGAIKTRERLFDELKIEIEAHKAVVEDRLYPLLSKHKETRDLKPTARELNQIDRQLNQVDGLAKDDPEFLPKVRELKKTMESQLREEERHIVPALKKALEADEFKELARELAEGKREEQQEARERNEAAAEPGNGQRQSDAASERQQSARSGGAAQAGAQHVVRELSEAGHSGARAMLEGQRRLSEASEASGRASVETASDLVARQVQNVASVSQEVASGAQEMQEALAQGVAEGLRVNAEAWSAAFRCGNLAELSTLQARLVGQWAQLQIDTGSRVMRATQRAMFGAFRVAERASSRRH